MEKILSAYRESYWLWETFLNNVESTIKLGFQTNKGIQEICYDFRERKGYNKPHRAKIELSELKYQKNIDFDLILSDVRKDNLKLHSRIRLIIDGNYLNHVDNISLKHYFASTVHWFWQFEKWFDNTFPIDSKATPKQTSFIAAIEPDKIPDLLQRLIDGKYIAPETTFEQLQAVFSGLPLLGNLKPIKWIKRPKKNKNTTAKKALSDLLLLIGIPKEQAQDIDKLKVCFTGFDGKPLIFTQSNFHNSKDNNKYSEYYPELKTIIESL